MNKRKTELTDKQLKILDIIAQSIASEGYPPTVREISAHFDNASTSVINYNLDRLVRAGLLVRKAKRARGIRLVERVGQS